MIVGLFPELSSTGGIARSGCLTALALASFAAQRGEKCRFVSLTDRAGAGSLKTGIREISFTGCGSSEMRFVLAASGLAIQRATGTELRALVAMTRALILRRRHRPAFDRGYN
jgi:hypothetical protein